MGAERFANRPATTVASGYTAASGTLVVDDSTDFPAAAPFHVLLGNTEGSVLRVDSMSGDTWTVTAEAFDANASIGATVKIVASKAVAERFVQSPDALGIHGLSGVAGADAYGPLHKIAPFVDSGWSWFNQGGATLAVVGGVAFLTVPQNSGQTIRGRAKSLGGVPYTAVFLVDTVMESSASQAAMWGFRESATAKFVAFRLEQSNIRVSDGTTSGTVNGDIYAKNWNNGRAHSRLWIKLEYNGTNVIFSFSFDGVNFVQVLSESKTAHFTTAPDQICFMGYDQNNSSFLCLSTLSLLETF